MRRPCVALIASCGAPALTVRVAGRLVHSLRLFVLYLTLFLSPQRRLLRGKGLSVSEHIAPPGTTDIHASYVRRQ